MRFNTAWTLESGPDDAPHVIELDVEYSYRFGSPDSWTQPGDPPECEILSAYGENEFGEVVHVSLVLRGEEGFLEYIYENPPEPDEPDWDY